MGKISENNLLESAFSLAYFILGDKESAELSAVAAMNRLNVAAVAQDRRYYYVPGLSPKAYGVRTKVTLNDLHLLQRLVYDETESWERKQEEHPHITDDELLKHFIKHLVRITLKRNSFYVAVGITRLLHRYSTPEAVDLYGVVVQNPGRTKDNHYWRSRKAQLLQEMKARFGDLVSLTRGAYGEERFACRDDSTSYAPFVNDCLKTLMFWDIPCPLPAGTESVTGSLPILDFRGNDPDEEHRVEIARIHAILHTDCFTRLIAGLNLDAPDTRLEIPYFFHPQRYGPNEPMNNISLHPTKMDQPDLNNMRIKLSEQVERLRRAHPQHVRLIVDRQERGILDLSTNNQVRFTLAQGEEFLELRTLPDKSQEEDVRLALYPFDYARLQQIEDTDEIVLRLADGRRLNFTFAPQRDEYGEITGATVTASYQPSRWQRWQQNLLAIVAPSAPAFSYALTAAMVLIGLTGALMLWRLLHTDSSEPNVAANKPQATANINQASNDRFTVPFPTVASESSQATSDRQHRTQNKTPRPHSTIKRESDVNSSLVVKSLSEVKQIFIQHSGSASANALNERLNQELQASGRWTVASQEDADGALNFIIKPGGQAASVQLVNANGEVIWPFKTKWRTYSGNAERIAKQVVDDLVKSSR